MINITRKTLAILAITCSSCFTQSFGIIHQYHAAQRNFRISCMNMLKNIDGLGTSHVDTNKLAELKAKIRPAAASAIRKYEKKHPNKKINKLDDLTENIDAIAEEFCACRFNKTNGLIHEIIKNEYYAQISIYKKYQLQHASLSDLFEKYLTKFAQPEQLPKQVCKDADLSDEPSLLFSFNNSNE